VSNKLEEYTNKRSLAEKMKEEKRENMSNSWRENERDGRRSEMGWLPVK
jgi:hypothetical protein